jgi:dihydropteroate synthase
MTVMGILNATPDSFWARSRYDDQAAVRRGLDLVAEGAGILDIGGESTRPGSAYVGAEEEIGRVLPVVRGLADAGCPVPLSVDTRKYEVMEAAHRAGATWLNDVAALQDDPRLGPFAAEAGLTVVLMHRQGHPDTMQAAPRYDDVASEVVEFLSRRVDAALAWGIRPENLVLDPGFGFGKTLDHTVQLFRALPRIRALGFRVLVGVSRKSFLGTLTGAPVEDRLAGSLAAALAAASAGTDVIRVHDVAATVQALKVWEALGPVPGEKEL